MSERKQKIRSVDTTKIVEKTALAKNLETRSVKMLPALRHGLTAVLVHQSAEIDPSTRFGERSGPVGRNVIVGPECIVSGALFSGAVLLGRVSVASGARIGTVRADATGGIIRLSEDVQVGPSSILMPPKPGHVSEIGKRTIIGSRAIIGASRAGGDKDGDYTAVIIGEDVTVGSRTIVTPGSIIGDGTRVGAGFVVATELPAGIIIADLPKGQGYRSVQQINPDWMQRNRSLWREA